ncbi:ParB/RepB/Spo0J family partition protein [Priestia endophytica]|jgi:ParB family chromosome partitioning protein|uniref:Chromosome partitioning protein ParB n=1 Tax=Priestia endophytica TaxID=135735 RepID=A0A3N6BAF0_9BACI|nr:ParB/RepB/Spo0J family partition protein [Priestia endophytica]KAB2491476.1 ParB/RepB/Spo0J family partition protein [Priestia endophytica]MCM3540450.1 ParB/RepB/Spo0J family partition protein [Priestia endophytica]MED4071566.1 ParB/RepB/Spo0J family partition protein [Priestia endophytica]RAS72934.1 chromosome partitioning protein ParB [Priestia endophytica]RAS86644.1 chromosome partitioning protein ParB [Priestia endophytica]
MGKGLGKGINALFSTYDEKTDETVQEIPLRELRPNPYQPRKIFHEEAIQELKESIEQHGILQPIVARKSIKGYEIVVGERRYRAATEAGLEVVPVIVRELTEKQMMELALLENLQREDLTPIEEGIAYQTLINQLEMTQEQLASRLGKSRPHISNHLRLLNLPQEVQGYLTEGKLSMGHGRALLGVKDKSLLVKLAQKVVEEKWNVRYLEQYITKLNKEESQKEDKQKPKKDLFLKESETRLRERFGTSVHITQHKKKGKIEIEFFSPDDLNRLLDLLQMK